MIITSWAPFHWGRHLWNPDFSDQIEFFFSSFDHVAAQRDGVLEMTPGSFPELDNAKSAILEWEKI